MEEIIVILVAFIILVIYCVFVWFIFFVTDSKKIYFRKLNSGLSSILIQCIDNNASEMNENYSKINKRIKRYYDTFVEENPSTKKHFPNLFVWLDSVLLKILYKPRGMTKIKGYYKEIEKSRNELEKLYPYNKCTDIQQEILNDIQRVADEKNKIVIDNITNRIEDEFIRMSLNIKKNDKVNKLSLIVGMVGAVISFISIVK